VQSSNNIARFFERWLIAVATRRKYENVILFLTDASYSLKAGRVPITFYPKMLHNLICAAHAFHRVAVLAETRLDYCSFP